MMAAVTLKYRSGEEIRRGDCVRFHGNAAEIEFVAFDGSDPDPEVVWHMKEHGGGIMILDPSASGRTFIPSAEISDYEDLEFVSRNGM
jgi:hypothetical protein